MTRPDPPADGRQGHLSETQTATSQNPPGSSREITAAAKAGLESVPCLVRDMTDAERVAIMLVENLQRSEIPVLAEASGYFRLVRQHGYTIRRLAKLGEVASDATFRRPADSRLCWALAA